MTFQKLHIKQLTHYEQFNTNRFIISRDIKSGFDVYFTNEDGLNQISNLFDKEITFQELPKPLLKQIK